MAVPLPPIANPPLENGLENVMISGVTCRITRSLSSGSWDCVGSLIELAWVGMVAILRICIGARRYRGVNI